MLELDFIHVRRLRILFWGVVTVVLLMGLTVLGHFVTPVEAGEPVLLSPDRWQAARLARKARQETGILQKDLASLLALLEEPAPDPVAAMLLAQGIYARHRTGTSATTPARQTLIAAAETVAAYAAGAAGLERAIFAVEEAIQRLDPLLLMKQEEKAVSRLPLAIGRRETVYLPLLVKGDESHSPSASR